MKTSSAGAFFLLTGCAGSALKQEPTPRGVASAPGQSKWLSGNYQPILDEMTENECEVMGTLPQSLQGLFLRNGPNPVYPPTPYHFFDGDGMLHSVRFEGGKAFYANRFVRTDGFVKERAAGRCLYGGLIAGPPIKNVANISLIWHHEKLLATWEGGSPYEIRPKTLETVGEYHFGEQWLYPFTAHPKIDPATGEMVIFGYDGNTIHYGVLSREGKLEHVAEIAISHPVMIHDFAITKNYSVFLDLPLVFTDHGLQYHPEFGARLGVIPRLGSNADIRWFKIDPCWVYHVLNAYEDGNKIVLRANSRPKWPGAWGIPYEWRIDLSSGTVSGKELDSALGEFPIIHPRHVGTHHRFGYFALSGKAESSGVIKYDLESGTKKSALFGENRSGGETFFVPRPNGHFEDSGWLLNFIYDSGAQTSELVILDAHSLEQEASVKVPHRVPYGLHCNWIPKA